MLTPQSVDQWNEAYDLSLNQFADATGACIIQNVVIDLVYNVLMLNLNTDHLYKPTNVPSNVERSMFQCDHCSNVGGSNPMRSNVSITNVSFQREVPMQWTNECPANGEVCNQ